MKTPSLETYPQVLFDWPKPILSAPPVSLHHPGAGFTWKQCSRTEAQRRTLAGTSNFLITFMKLVPELPGKEVFRPDFAARKLSRLAQLDDGWDGDGAHAPSDRAVSAAREALKKMPSVLRADEIEADAMGGIAIWLALTEMSIDTALWSWLSCKNSGRVSLILQNHNTARPAQIVAVENWAPTFEVAVRFLSGDS